MLKGAEIVVAPYGDPPRTMLRKEGVGDPTFF